MKKLIVILFSMLVGSCYVPIDCYQCDDGVEKDRGPVVNNATGEEVAKRASNSKPISFDEEGYADEVVICNKYVPPSRVKLPVLPTWNSEDDKEAILLKLEDSIREHRVYILTQHKRRTVAYEEHLSTCTIKN